ncbi:MAG: hypothetical protein WCJ09_13845 [Planctomycetota bacterium]
MSRELLAMVIVLGTSVAVGAEPPQVETPKKSDNAVASSGLFKNVISPEIAYAWQSTEKYLAPDSEKFFPVNAEAGTELDRIFLQRGPEFKPDDAVLKLIRQGLRSTRAHRTVIVRWVGNTYIWGKDEQNADAIELMYHASDFRGPTADPFGTRHYAVYFGLSVVQKKSPAILRTLVDLSLAVDDPNDLDRIAWGSKTQRDELLAFVEPHLKSDDAAIRAKADVLQQIFQGKLKAFAWAAEQARLRALAKYGEQLPKFKTILSEGTSEERLQLLVKIVGEQIFRIMDDSFLPAFAKCAEDPDEQVRNQVVIVSGGHWVWWREKQHPDAIQLMLKMSHDQDDQVRYNAVYYGLSTVRNKKDDVISRLLEMAFDAPLSDLPGRITWGLSTDKPRTKVLLTDMITGKDEDLAHKARQRFKELTGEELPAK